MLVKRSDMSLKEAICRALILGVRILCAPIVWFTATTIIGSTGINWNTRETPSLVFFVGYAAFVFIPILRQATRPFVVLSVLGGIIAIGSLLCTVRVYIAVVELFDNALIFRIMASLLLLYFYSYLPVTLSLRHIRHSARSEPIS